MSRAHLVAALRPVRRDLRDPLTRGAYSLMLNSVLTALAGLGFWMAAARLRTPHQVGQDGALVTAMVTLASICQLNIANALTRFLPRAGTRTRRWIVGGYAVAGGVTTAGALGFVLAAPALSHQLAFLRSDRVLAVAFVAASGLWTTFALQDAVLVALRRAPWIPLENALFGLMKLALLPGFVALAVTHAVFISWMVPMVLLLAPVNYLIFRRFVPEHVRRHPDSVPVSELLPSARIRRFLAADYVGSVLHQLGLALPTLLVIALLGSSANAYFYVPFMIVTAFDTLFFDASNSLVVEGAFATDAIGELARRFCARVVKLLIPGVLVIVASASLLLLPFGSRYVTHGASVMRLLACASVFRVMITLFAAISRVQGKGGRILGVYGVVVCALAPLLLLLSPALGIEGAALAWLGANALAALLIAPLLAGVLLAGRRPFDWLRRVPSRPSRPGAGVPWRAMATASGLTSAAAIVVSFGLTSPGVRFAVLLAFICTAPGTAVLGAIDAGSERVSPVVVLAVGLALGAIIAQLLLLVHTWWPAQATRAAAATCVLVLLAAARRRGRRGRRWWQML